MPSLRKTVANHFRNVIKRGDAAIYWDAQRERIVCRSMSLEKWARYAPDDLPLIGLYTRYTHPDLLIEDLEAFGVDL